MNIPLLDLRAQYRVIRPEIEEAIRQVLESGQFILGANVAALEREVAAYLGSKYAVGVGSGTDALVLALRALEIGIGDEVIVPTYTFFATAEAVMLLGATPIFVDIDPKTYCLNVRQVAERITARTKAVIPVHLYGQSADLAPLLDLAGAHGFKVVEDNAQAFGAEYKGHKTGSLSHVGCLSFFPSKNLGAYGDAGMVVTNDVALAERVQMLRTHGWRTKYYPEQMGYNSRLDELQAACLRVKLRYVDVWNDRRRELAHRLSQRLMALGISIPYEAPQAKHVYHLYIVRLKDRVARQRYLNEQGIGSAVYYPVALHLTEPCRVYGYGKGDFPIAELATRETLALPLYPEMTEEQLERVITAVRNIVQSDSSKVVLVDGHGTSSLAAKNLHEVSE
jgi:dTDP-4-amino-4,6-dideoxygalactose transaminase